MTLPRAERFLSGLALCNPDAYIEVPAGTYPYGERGQAIEIEAPFLLGRFPVTNGQYRAFVDDGGYSERTWWSDAGWAWRTKEQVREPLSWHNRRWNGPNQPVVGVSFFEAKACASWAGGRLPTEQEWEAAARGPEGSTYPWGNNWKDRVCNTREAGLGATSPVGLFPHSRQAHLGLEDLAGNVWEWCSNCDATDGDFHVVRGGSWNLSQVLARCAVRFRRYPDVRGYDIGFRIAMERE